MALPAIRAEDVAKEFVVRTRAGRIRRSKNVVAAVDGITLEIAPGEMVGYIGPNGAGKSTTIKMLTGILVPTRGSLRVLGLEPHIDRVPLARRIGVVFGQRTQLWWDLPLGDSFELLHHVYKTEPARHRENLNWYVDLLDLGPLLETPVRQLSLGQRMRGELTAALLHDPAVVFLDEPTIGLDVVSKFAVRDFLRDLNQDRGTTVLLTTHDLSDIEQLCERMVIIDQGKIIHDGSLEAFRRSYGDARTVVVDLEDPEALLDIPQATRIDGSGHRRVIHFSKRAASAGMVIREVVNQARVVDVIVEEPAIEELVREIYLAGD